jgi:hypothetical protein
MVAAATIVPADKKFCFPCRVAAQQCDPIHGDAIFTVAGGRGVSREIVTE